MWGCARGLAPTSAGDLGLPGRFAGGGAGGQATGPGLSPPSAPGLQVAVGSLDHTARVTPLFAAFTVAIPLTTFMVVLGLLNRSSVPAGIRLTLLAAALILATAAAAPILTLPASIVIMVVLVALLLAYYLAAGRRATR